MPLLGRLSLFPGKVSLLLEKLGVGFHAELLQAKSKPYAMFLAHLAAQRVLRTLLPSGSYAFWLPSGSYALWLPGGSYALWLPSDINRVLRSHAAQ